MEIDTSFAPFAAFLAEALYWVFIGLLLLNVVQRKHQKYAEKKRFATLYLALAAFALLLGAQAILTFGGRDLFLIPLAGAVLGTLWYFRERTFPFRVISPVDGRRLTWHEILFQDNHGDERGATGSSVEERSEEEPEDPSET